jgi:hypothetical protein
VERPVNDLVNLIQIVLVLATTASPIVGAIWLLAGDDHVGRTSSGQLPWPRGIQEEEPQPWQIRPAAGLIQPS